MAKLSKYMPSMEGIVKKVNPSFKTELIKSCKVLLSNKELSDKLIDKSNLLTVINRHTGLSLSLKIDKGTNKLSIKPFDNSYVSSKLKEFDKYKGKGIDKVLSEIDKVFNGNVDLTKGIVTGELAKVEVSLTIGSDFIGSNKVHEEELATLIVSKIGFIFAHLELFTRSVKTNIRTLILPDIILNVPKEQRISVIKKINKSSGYDSKQTKIFEETDSKETIIYTLIAADGARCKIETGYQLFDVRGLNELAEDYVSNVGLGIPLAVMSEKGILGADALDVILEVLFATIHSLMMGFIVALALGFGTALPFALSAFISIVVATLVFLFSTQNLWTGNNSSIFNIKNIILSLKGKSNFITTLDMVEKILPSKETLNKLTIFFNNQMLPWGRRKLNAIESQRELDKMVSNELFVRASKLKALKG